MRIGYCTECNARVVVTTQGGCPMGHASEHILDGPGGKPFDTIEAPVASFIPQGKSPKTSSSSTPPPSTSDTEQITSPAASKPAQPPRKKGRRLAGLAAAAVLVLAVAGAGIGAYSLFRMTPEKAMAETASAMTEVETMSFTMEMTTESGGMTLISTGEGEMRLPFDARMTVTTNIAGQDISFDQVTVDDRAYVKYSNVDLWGYMDMGASALEAGLSQSPQDSLSFLESFSSLKSFEDEEIDGIDCYHLGLKISGEKLIDSMEGLETTQGVDADESGDQGLMQEMYPDADIYVEVWIGIKDMLLHREDVSIDLPGQEITSITTKMFFSDFNEPVDIEAPEGAIPFEELIQKMSQGYTGEVGVNEEKACYSNMRLIVGAAEIMVDETGSAPAKIEDLVPTFLVEVPICRSGGTYTWDPEQMDIVCSVHDRY